MNSQEAEIFWLALGALFLPLLSCVASFCIPARYSWVTPIAASFVMLVTTCCSFLLFNGHSETSPAGLQYHWLSFGRYDISVGLSNDYFLILTVSIVSFLIHLFSIGYMAGEAGMNRYFGWLGFFTFSMIGFVLVDNLLSVFAFWEFIGVSSYFLIGFWRERTEPVFAANKAFLMNRLGDVCLLVGILILWASTKTLNINEISGSIAIPMPAEIAWAGFFILIGVLPKSAQFPMFSWLPDAMEGPTPVSALLHAATLVVAGIYLVYRIGFIFDPSVRDAVVVIGSTTAFCGALAALNSFNIKKILAWSTVSQLGLMFMALGSFDSFSAVMHLYAHAYFKAGLFLVAGAVALVMEQVAAQNNLKYDVLDIRNMGGMARQMKLVFACTVICAASLAGLPFTSGFSSKIGMIQHSGSRWVEALEFLVSAMTVFYSFRLVWYVFLAKPAKSELASVKFPQVPWVMQIPLIALAFGSLWFMSSEFPLQFLHFNLSGVMMALSLTCTAAAYFYYRKRTLPSRPEYNWIKTAFGIDLLISFSVVKPTLHASKLAAHVDSRWIDRALHGLTYAQVTFAHLTSWFDRNVVDGLVVGASNLFRSIGNVARSVANGKIQAYILWALAGMVIFMIRNLLSQN